MRLAPADLGKRAERRAMWFYRLRGFRILGRNVRFADGEIDLVVRRGKLLVIVEVKARSSIDIAAPWEAVDAKKRAKLMKLAERYLAANDVPRAWMLRYDILSMAWNGRRFVVTQFADAFRAVSDPVRPWVLRV